MFGMGSKVDTLIGTGAEFKGNLGVEGSVFIDGKVEGNVHASEHATMGDKGQVKGNLTAPELVIGGRVQGNLHASVRVELLATAVLEGDIHSPRLIVAEGAVFDGKCFMEPAAGEAVEFRSAKR